MEDLLIAVLQAAFEFALEVLSNVGLDWPLTSRSNAEPRTLSLTCCGWFLAGCALGALSVWVLKRTWIPFPSLRMANLVAAPLTSAYVGRVIARWRRQKHRHIIPRNHFWRSFWFTLALVAVRFAYAIRPHG